MTRSMFSAEKKQRPLRLQHGAWIEEWGLVSVRGGWRTELILWQQVTGSPGTKKAAAAPRGAGSL